jgi:hypothetical protein
MSVGILSDDEKIATSLAAPRNDAELKTVATLRVATVAFPIMGITS